MVREPTIVREARQHDVDGIARVHVDAWRETYTGMVPERYFSDAAYRQRQAMWTRYLAMNPRPGGLTVAVEGERIVGFSNAGPARGPDVEKGHTPARPLHLYSIYLLAAEHGKGVGSALLHAAIGHEPAQLWVAAGNDRAIAFYRRHGFMPDGVEVTDPDLERLVELRMVR